MLAVAHMHGSWGATLDTCAGKSFFLSFFFFFFARSQRRRPERVGARLLDIIKSVVYTGMCFEAERAAKEAAFVLWALAVA